MGGRSYWKRRCDTQPLSTVVVPLPNVTSAQGFGVIRARQQQKLVRELDVEENAPSIINRYPLKYKPKNRDFVMVVRSAQSKGARVTTEIGPLGRR
jgi:hypothetical protein